MCGSVVVCVDKQEGVHEVLRTSGAAAAKLDQSHCMHGLSACPALCGCSVQDDAAQASCIGSRTTTAGGATPQLRSPASATTAAQTFTHRQVLCRHAVSASRGCVVFGWCDE